MTPLADKIRPTTLDEIVGQPHLLAPGKPLRRILERGQVTNMIFYGPSGVGKTTLARIIASNSNMTLYKLNGTSASLISPTEAEVPFSLYRVMLLLLAMIRARVVFPTPDGP